MEVFLANRKERRAAKSKGGLQNPATQELFNQAVLFHQAGQMAEAESLYRQILGFEPHHADSLHLLGLIAYQVGRYDIATELIGQAIGVNGKISSYHNNLGLTFHQQGRHADAITSYRRALALAPDDAEILNNLGVTLEYQGSLNEGLSCYKKALSIRPDYASAFYNTGNVFRKLHRPDDAVASYKNALAINPNYVEACNNLGVVLKEQGQYSEAAEYTERALTIKPDHIEALVNLGSIFKELENPKEAIIYYQKALALKPDYVDANNNLGLALHDLNRFDEAIEYYKRALVLAPNRPEILNNFGTTLEEQGQLDAAQDLYRQALALQADCAEAYYNLGNSFKKLGRLDQAVKNYDLAIAIRPDYAEAHWNQAFILLLKGDLIPGWREGEWRWHRKNMKPHGFKAPLWDGQSLEGKTILLHCEQGFGDSIQFIRYAKLVKEKGGHVCLLCPPSLESLFKSVAGIDRIEVSGKDDFAHDCQAPLLSLPGLLGTTLETIPATVPYLHPDSARTIYWRDRLKDCPGLKIGVVWRGNPQHKNDRNRSMLPAQFAEFLDLPGLSVINLQKDARLEEIQALGAAGALINAGPELGDFSDAAALIKNLDLVISVDTSLCHLAGALDVPVWTLLPFAPDWRWLLNRSDTPWYPKMRLLRQPQPGDWSFVIHNVRGDLMRLRGEG